MDNIDLKQFLDLTIEEIFADRFSRYSKYVIQDRALPDVRDGLKPVQRRILYSMNKEGNTFDKQFRKSAKTVGNVIGNYHPHGDTSVYDAMVRTSQNWKVNKQLVIMHGNNGSIDGDSAAAMRYTEAKLSKYSELILTDINEDTVNMVPNFDDTELEPTVLPSRVPNLLVNGASGISSGYATDIPPHNPYEVVSAAIFVNKNRTCRTDSILKYINGPDFPTGAIVQGVDEIKKAYQTGKGKIQIRSKYVIEKDTILIKEIPYDVNKQALVAKIDMIRYEKKVDGIVEVIDQSDKDILEIAITCKKDANKEVILNYLFKYTDLQKNYSFNMIAISNRRPKLLSINEILLGFINHREDVIIRRSKYRVKRAKNKLHIVEGLIKAVDIMDRIILIIRNSKDKKDSISNLIKEFDFTDKQAEAIVMMQLYRLSNTDIVNLVEEQESLNEDIKTLNAILDDEDVLITTIDSELKEVLKTLENKRRTTIEEEIEKIEINNRDLIKSENNIVSISKNGYVKRSTVRSYLASTSLSTTMDDDIIVSNIKANTRDNLLVFFNDGSFVNMFVHDIAETKFKDVGKHISTYAKVNDGIHVINMINTNQFNDLDYVYSISKGGYFNKIPGSEFNVKLKNKVVYQKLKADDEVISVEFIYKKDLNLLDNNKYFVLTNLDRYLCFDNKDIELSSLRRVGRKIMTFRKEEYIIGSLCISKDMLLMSNKGGYVRIDYNDLNTCDKPLQLFENIKTNKHQIIKLLSDLEHDLLLLDKEENVVEVKDFSKTKVSEKIKTSNKFKEIKNVERLIDIN